MSKIKNTIEAKGFGFKFIRKTLKTAKSYGYCKI